MDLIVDRVRLSSNPTDDTTMDNGMQLCLVALESKFRVLKCLEYIGNLISIL